MPNTQVLIDRMKYWCNSGNLGYDQSNRWDIRVGGEADCSSLVIHCLQEAGFDVGNATYTGNMSANLCARGWVRLPNNGNPSPGDILLNDVHHVAVYLGGGLLAQASHDERGRGSGGQSGDQASETNVKRYYNYPWNCYLRYMGKQDGNTTVQSSEDFLMALSQYDQELTRNAVVSINNRTDAMQKQIADIQKRLGPISAEYPFDYLPAILNNLNSLFAIVGKSESTTLSDDQLTNLADSLKQGLGDQVVKALADKLSK